MASIKHILLATDLSDRTERAFERCIRLAREHAATLHLLHVVEAGFTPEVRDRKLAIAEEYFREKIGDLPDADRHDIRFTVETGDPFATIIMQAQAHSTDLIVLGEPGKKGIKELFVGTTAERVIRHSDRPVLIIKQSPVDGYRRVLVAVDFSEGASRALEAACKVAPGAELIVVHAWQVPAVGIASLQTAEKVTAEENEFLRRRVERQARDHLIASNSPHRAPRIEMKEGNPFFVIREAIASFQPDLLAMGTHARSGIAVAMVGSLAREFLVEASCDVLVAQA